MSVHFPESLEVKVKVELDLSNYATKSDFKNATGVDTSKFDKQVDLANLKTNVDKLDIAKLENVPTNLSNLKTKQINQMLINVPVDLSKLSNAVKNNVVEKYVYNGNIKNIEDKTSDITNLATNASVNAKINEFEGEISTYLATNASLNAKINEVKGKIPNITNLASTTALTTVEKKMLNVSNLVTKTDYNTKKSEIENKITDHDHDKYIITPEFNKLTEENFTARLKQAN